MTNRYTDILKQAPQPGPTSSAIDELRKFCSGITQYAASKGRCELERGYLVNHGQEFRITLTRADNQYKLVLLRAYVPHTDFPVLLDTYAEDMVKCKDLTELTDELSKFLSMEYIQNQIMEWLR